jgi:hypothetical protein
MARHQVDFPNQGPQIARQDYHPFALQLVCLGVFSLPAESKSVPGHGD